MIRPGQKKSFSRRAQWSQFCHVHIAVLTAAPRGWIRIPSLVAASSSMPVCWIAKTQLVWLAVIKQKRHSDILGNYVLTITVAYNDTDRTFGRHHSLRDFSIYLDSRDENIEIVNAKSRVHVMLLGYLSFALDLTKSSFVDWYVSHLRTWLVFQ